MSARHEIEQTLFRYARGFDEYDIDMLVDSFCEDAEVFMSGNHLVGKEAIRESFEERRRARADRGVQPRHMTTNVMIDEETDEFAVVHSYYAMVQLEGGSWAVLSTGSYDDRLVNEGGTWRIKHRRSNSDAQDGPLKASR